MRRFWFTIIATLSASYALAAQPVEFNYQARLKDASGVPLTGLHTLYFTLFEGGDANTSGSGAITFAESDNEVLTDGIVSHTVGTGTPISGTLNATQFEFNGDIFLQVSVDDPNTAVLPRTRLAPVPFAVKALDAPATLFGQFGGNGIGGDLTVSGSTTFAIMRSEFHNFTVPAGTTITASLGWAFIGVEGTCTIAGTVSADGVGAQAGMGAAPGTGGSGKDATQARISTNALENCASGAGGAGGAGQSGNGGNGGGAQGDGGTGGPFAGSYGQSSNRPQILAGGVSSLAGSGQTLTSNFQPLLQFVGAGGGGGGAFPSNQGGNGGQGGGVIYIECNELVLTGNITANGLPGGSVALGPAGAGGGGGGGVVLVRARKITTNTGTVSAAGGPGGTGAGGGVISYNGGNGGDGFWDVVEIH